MVDVLTPEQRRLNMSRIRGRDTKPEILVRRALHARGYRFRLHRKDLPGRPDIVLPRHRVAIFVHGCFWHNHGCRYSKVPATRTSFWNAKLHGNKARDDAAVRELHRAAWHVVTIWECALRGPAHLPIDELCDHLESYIRAPTSLSLVVSGQKSYP
jgi:DNA mismatch endonuclease (patch repair protein)